MKIASITLTVVDLTGAAAFYRNTLNMRVEENADHAVVHAGSSQLRLVQGEKFDGVHHVAFGIRPAEFEQAHAWLRKRVPLIVKNGRELFVSSNGWNSRSVYFLGPEDIILEFIARDADADAESRTGESPHILSISEIGIAVPDVPAAAKRLLGELAIPPFYDQGENFAPLGNHDGLLIVVQQDRIWFPTESLRPARGPLTVSIASAIENTQLDLTAAVRIETVRSSY